MSQNAFQAKALTICVVAALLASAPIQTLAQDAANERIQYKLTFGHYTTNGGPTARDLNLRTAWQDWNVWGAAYRDDSGFRQARGGIDKRLEFSWIRLALSAQLGSGGARVASVTHEVGGDWYLIAGFGRSNLRPYINLNYDPNDAVTLGMGARAYPGLELSLFQVRDDRLGTGQRVTHLVWRQRWGDRHRLTLDVADKAGRLDTGAAIEARSATVTYDYTPYFIRVAYDPFAGFGPYTQTRLSGGFRF